MGLDVYLVRADDWSEYDRLYGEYKRAAFGKDKNEELAGRIREKMGEISRDVTSEMPEEWRKPLHVKPDDSSYEIGYIAGSWAHALDNVPIDFEWTDRYGFKNKGFPYLHDIACGCYDGYYCPNDWERTYSLGLRCLRAVNRRLIEIRKKDGAERRNKYLYNCDYGTVRDILSRVIVLAKLILATGEPQKYRVVYSD